MKLLAFAWLSALVLPLEAWAQQAPVQPAVQAPYSIGGVAVNAATNAPMSKALVRIALPENPRENRMVITGPDGRFLFSNLPARKFVLTVERQSGPPHAFLADGQYSTALVTGPDQDTTHLVFPYHMPGIISGTVVDENNEPIPNAQVQVFARTVVNGLPRVTTAGVTQTRNSGTFTVPHLTPGTYSLGVSAQPWFGSAYSSGMHTMVSRPRGNDPNSNGGVVEAGPPDPRFDIAYPFTYYSGTTDPASASPIVVGEGSNVPVQVVLRAGPAAHVHIAGLTANTNIFAMPVGPDGQAVQGGSGSMVAKDGEGELSGLAPGRYQLMIMSFDEKSGGNTRNSRKIVDIADGATIDASDGSHISVTATVKFAGSEQPQNKLSLMLQNDMGNGVRGVSGANNTFQFPQARLTPGSYRLYLPNTPAFYIKTLEAKGAKVVDDELILENSSDVSLSVVLAKIGKEATLEGFAVRGDKPAAGAMVLFIPQASNTSHPVGRDQSDSDGSFAIANVSPGKYWALAIDNGHDLAYADPAVIKPYLAGALPVTITDTAKLPMLKIPVQTRQQ